MADINRITTEEALDERSPLFKLAHEKWTLVCDLFGGTDRMRACGETYLPREVGERATDKDGDIRFQARLNRSTLTNFYKKTLVKHVGKVFSAAIKHQGYVTKIEEWLENVDLRNNDLTEFGKNVFLDGYNKGVTYIVAEHLKNPLVSADPAAPKPSIKAEKDLGMRPYLAHIPANRMLDIRGEYLRGKFVPVLVRYVEEVIEYPEVGFTPSLVTQVKILQPGSWSIWRYDTEVAMWYQHDAGATNLKFIPIVDFNPNPCGFMLGTPVLEELAEKTVQYWRESSDLSNILNKVASPILHYRGQNVDAQGNDVDLVVGPNALVISNQHDNVLEYVEHTGSAISANQENLKIQRDEMTLLGLEPLQVTSKTATEANLASYEANSTLKAMALRLQDRLEQAIVFMACYTGDAQEKDGEMVLSGSLTVNTNYGIQGGEASESEFIETLGEKGYLSKVRVMEELQRRNVVNPDLDAQELIDEASKEKVTEPTPPADPNVISNQTPVEELVNNEAPVEPANNEEA